MFSVDLSRSVWELDADDFPTTGDLEDQAKFLLRYAILAPSSHNSQPWRFRIVGNQIIVGSEESRWLKATDPDKRELNISIGCAIENLCIAARYFGFDPRVTYHETGQVDYLATLTLPEETKSQSPRSDELFEVLTARHTSHDQFEDRTVGDDICEQLRTQVAEDEVSLSLIDDSETKESISELQAEADRMLMKDPTYRKELGHWIGIGALGSSGLMARVGKVIVTHFDIGNREAAKNSKRIESAPVVAVLTADSDTVEAQVRTGQAFERVALRACTEDIAVQPMSQTLERPELRTKLEDLLPENAGVPQHLFCLGFTDCTADHTPRWPLEKVLVEG